MHPRNGASVCLPACLPIRRMEQRGRRSFAIIYRPSAQHGFLRRLAPLHRIDRKMTADRCERCYALSENYRMVDLVIITSIHVERGIAHGVFFTRRRYDY